MIHNLSNHTLTEDEFSVLTKGFSFVRAPTKSFKQETNKSWNKFKTRTLKQKMDFQFSPKASLLFLPPLKALNKKQINPGISLKRTR